MMKKIIYIAITTVIAAVAIYAVIQIAPNLITKVGTKPISPNFPAAPDFNLTDISGKIIRLSDLRGSIVVLYFWTSWNGISLENLKTIDDYKARLPSDAVLVTVNSLEEKTVVENILNEKGIKTPTLLDENGEVGELYNISTLPLAVFIDKDGRETSRFIGELNAQKLDEKIAFIKQL
jgi:peroxiredoxin